MPKIVATHPIFPAVARRLSECGELIVNDRGTPWTRQQLIECLADADALLAFMTDTVDRELLRRCRKLKIIACALKGYDNFDVAACTRSGVWLTVVPDLLTIPTAELAVALMLGLNRNLLAGDARVRSGSFDGWRADLYGYGLHGATVGIAGLGRVGLAIAERLRGFGARVRGCDECSIPPDVLAAASLSQMTWDDMITDSDVIVLALPLNERTFHLVNADALNRMRQGTRIINVGRGSVVDEDAVAQSLESGHLGGYAADVFEMEDWARPDRPRAVSRRLLALRDRSLFTPHLGSAVGATRLAIERTAANAIMAVLRGERPENAVNDPHQSP